LRKRSNDLVSFATGLASAAGNSWCRPSQELLMELVAFYVVLLILFPDTVILITGLFILALASAF
tara:strand:+ start:310 stop:504 length:195 start_codon:yes stop_codon:yes gene_type:complete